MDLLIGLAMLPEMLDAIENGSKMLLKEDDFMGKTERKSMNRKISPIQEKIEQSTGNRVIVEPNIFYRKDRKSIFVSLIQYQ